MYHTPNAGYIVGECSTGMHHSHLSYKKIRFRYRPDCVISTENAVRCEATPSPISTTLRVSNPRDKRAGRVQALGLLNATPAVGLCVRCGFSLFLTVVSSRRVSAWRAPDAVWHVKSPCCRQSRCGRCLKQSDVSYVQFGRRR